MSVENATKNFEENKAKYESEYSDDNFWNKIKDVFQKAGVKVIYQSLKLYYAYKREETPLMAKTTIIGALGYFIAPIDVILDVTPVVGYSDDLAVLATALVVVAVHIDANVKKNAENKLNEWFGDYDKKELQ